MDFFHFHGIPAFWRSIPVRSQVVLLGKFAHFLPFVLTLEQKNLLGKKKTKRKKKAHNNKFPFFVAQKYRVMQIYAKNTSPKREQLERLILSTENKFKIARFCISKQRNLIFYTNRHFPIPNPSSSAVSKPFWETDFLVVSSLVFLTSHLSPTAPHCWKLGWKLGSPT